jgi:long-chain acyl-CoA synthetase
VDDLFDQVIVIGEGQSFLSAILVLNPEHWFSLAKQHHLDSFDSDSLKNKELHAAIVSRLRKLLHDFPSYARIRKVTLTLEPWTTENDLLTATLKVRRPQVIAFHQTDINAMYDVVS